MYSGSISKRQECIEIEVMRRADFHVCIKIGYKMFDVQIQTVPTKTQDKIALFSFTLSI